jgi:hypothetical protein
MSLRRALFAKRRKVRQNTGLNLEFHQALTCFLTGLESGSSDDVLSAFLALVLCSAGYRLVAAQHLGEIYMKIRFIFENCFARSNLRLSKEEVYS